MRRLGHPPVVAPLQGDPGTGSEPCVTRADLVVWAAMLGLGGLQVALAQRAPDFIAGDVTYCELARSIVEGRSYGFDARLETLLPPGFPAILALLCVTVGCGYNALIRCMPVFGALGFIASYELLRREEGRGVAAAVCLLLMSSIEVFAFSTSLVFSDLPYLLASSLSLLLVVELQKPMKSPLWVAKWLSLCVFLPASLMIRSAGVALLFGLAAWLAASWLSAPDIAARRTRTLLPPLLVGLLVQGAWMYWGQSHEVSEWPIGGYPKSYPSQLLVKSGNEPELGMAAWPDVGVRVAYNAIDRATNVVELLCRRWVSREWSSPAVFGAITLLLFGIADSIRRGGAFHDWYFIGHETMYLLWPWDFEERFVLPVVPLGCLYLWRGGRVLVRRACRAPEPFARAFLPLAAILAGGSFAWLRRSGGMQATLSLVFWVCSAALAACMALGNRDRPQARLVGWAGRALQRPLRVSRPEPSVAQGLGFAGVAALVGLGLVAQLQIGEKNRHLDPTQTASYPAVQAGIWLRTHSAESAVVMARELDIVYHYSGRRVVWFPPLTDPAVLIEGIRQKGVDLVVVTDGRMEYWRPNDRRCFDRLRAAHPDAFHLVHEDRTYQIFSVSQAPGGIR